MAGNSPGSGDLSADKSAEFTVNVFSISFDGLDGFVDSFTRLFDALWAKSPFLACLLVSCMVILPFYIVYTWGTLRSEERKLDRSVKDSRKNHKK
jgi:hypothetical protein